MVFHIDTVIMFSNNTYRNYFVTYNGVYVSKSAENRTHNTDM